MANIFVAYICWFIGGPFGLHHFYLGRDKQSFVWWISLGGFFLGWFRDLWRLPEYVYEANNDPRFVREFKMRRQLRPKPPFHVTRFAGQIVIGYLLALLARLLIPEKVLGQMDENLSGLLVVILPVLGAAIGVSLVANIGHRKCDFKWCLLGSVLAAPWLLQNEPSLIVGPLFASIIVSFWKSEWNPDKRPPKGKCTCLQRMTVLAVAGLIYSTIFISVIVYNVHVTTNDGMKVPINEALENFFNSPAWKEFKKTMGSVYDYCQTQGWDHCWSKIIEEIDPSGESHAYTVLGYKTGDNPAADDIKSRCRKLSREWHPDKMKTETDKQAAQEKFIEIQKACDTLNVMRKRRSDRNMKSDTSKKDKDKFNRRTEF